MPRLLSCPHATCHAPSLGAARWRAVVLACAVVVGGAGAASVQAQGLLPVTGAVWLPQEAGVPLLAGLVAALAALLPAMQAYRTDVADLLVQP